LAKKEGMGSKSESKFTPVTQYRVWGGTRGSGLEQERFGSEGTSMFRDLGKERESL